MADLRDLAVRLRKKAAAINAAANSAKIRVAETILGDLVYVTPVDTSQALSNWQVRINQPVEAQIKPYYAGSKGSTRSASAAEALNVGKRIAATAKPGEPIFISNVLPYIKRLNDGHSKQQPAGFVERSVLLGRKFIEGYRLKL